MVTRELQEQITDNMKRWQQVEDAAVSSTAGIIDATDNPLVKLIMEVINRDSKMHRQVQEFITDSLKQTMHLSVQDLEIIWDRIQQHLEIEQQTVKLAQEALSSIKGRRMVIQEYLLNYLLEDERKHNHLLEHLATGIPGATIRPATHPH